MDKPFAVLALVVDTDGDVLAITRRNCADDWGLIGGKVDPGETPTQALIREVREEAGIEVQEDDIMRVFTRDENTSPCWTYFVKSFKGSPRAMENGFKVRWISREELLSDKNTYHAYNRSLFTHLEAGEIGSLASERIRA